MTRIEATATVTADGRLLVQVPPEVRISPGQHQVVVEVQDEPDERSRGNEIPDLPVIHVGAWPRDVPLRREDLYGDGGR
jgi:hypothetical protein